MKLIIDIPREDYKTLSKMSEKEKVNELDYYEKIISNGIPYEEGPQEDFISREALKKAISEATYNFEQIPIRVDKVQEIIDNAPSVSDRYDEGYAQGYIDGSTGVDWRGEEE